LILLIRGAIAISNFSRSLSPFWHLWPRCICRSPASRRGTFKFEIDKVWIATPNIHYHMGIDGISVWLVVLTTFLTPLCVLISWTSIHARVRNSLFCCSFWKRPSSDLHFA